jgi:hypothetical protein
MSIKLNTQLVLLSAASQRDDHCLVPPTGPKRSQAQRAVAKLLEAGFLKEMRAKAGAPIWRCDEETGHTYALKLTAAGVRPSRSTRLRGRADREPIAVTIVAALFAVVAAPALAQNSESAPAAAAPMKSKPKTPARHSHGDGNELAQRRSRRAASGRERLG